MGSPPGNSYFDSLRAAAMAKSRFAVIHPSARSAAPEVDAIPPQRITRFLHATIPTEKEYTESDHHQNKKILEQVLARKQVGR